MPFNLRITDGTTTVNLNDGTVVGCNSYVPATPELSTDYMSTPGDGSALAGARFERVAESGEFDLLGGLTTARATIATLNRLFMQARRYELGYGGEDTKPVYVEFQPSGDATYYRSQLFTGRLELTEGEIGAPLDMQWVNNILTVTLAWERRYYWEGAETAITLHDGTAFATTQTVYNNVAGGIGARNYVQFGPDWGGSSLITGDLPTPPLLKITNNYNDVVNTPYFVWVGLDAWGETAGILTTLQGEDGNGGTNVGDANSSGGNYKTFTITGTTKNQLTWWLISGGTLANFNGAAFRVMARFATTPAYTDLRLSVQLRLAGTGVVIYETGQTLINFANGPLVEVGTVRLPPVRGLPGYDGLELVLTAQRDTGGGSLNIDYLHLTPMDGFRAYTPLGFGVAYQDMLVDDGPREKVYVDALPGSNVTNSFYHVLGKPFMLWPGNNHRFFFFHTTATGSAAIARTLSIQVSYRPRRVVL